MATGRIVSGQFRCDACMKNKSIIDHRKKLGPKCFLCILVIVDNKLLPTTSHCCVLSRKVK